MQTALSPGMFYILKLENEVWALLGGKWEGPSGELIFLENGGELFLFLGANSKPRPLGYGIASKEFCCHSVGLMFFVSLHAVLFQFSFGWYKSTGRIYPMPGPFHSVTWAPNPLQRMVESTSEK